jgi:hypothetical protein
VPCNHVEVDRRFGGVYCLHHQDEISQFCINMSSSSEPALSLNLDANTSLEWYMQLEVYSPVLQLNMSFTQDHMSVRFERIELYPSCQSPEANTSFLTRITSVQAFTECRQPYVQSVPGKRHESWTYVIFLLNLLS